MLVFAILVLTTGYIFESCYLAGAVKMEPYNRNEKCFNTLMHQINLIKYDCGEICQTSSSAEKVYTQGKFICLYKVFLCCYTLILVSMKFI